MRAWVLGIGGLLAVVGLALHSDGPLQPEARSAPTPQAAAGVPELIGRPAPPLDVTPVRKVRPPSKAEAVADEETLEEIEAPADLPQRGPHAVHIALVDDRSGVPVSSQVQLWRLDAPENEHWKRGDQLQATAQVGEDGLQFEHLPAGQYRIYAEDQHWQKGDPPAFDVGAFPERHIFQIPMPRVWSARLQIYDERGRMFRRAESDRSPLLAGIGPDAPVPSWRKARVMKPVEGLVFDEECETCWDCEQTVGRIEHLAEADGFLLEPIQENSRRSAVERMHLYLLAGRSKVHVRARPRVERDHVYQAVSVPLEPIQDAVTLPDGRPALAAGASFDVRCRAKLSNPFVPFDPRAHRVRVTVELLGFESLAFHVVPGDPIAPRTMKVTQ